MANKFYEYKLHMKSDGVNHPDFVLNGGYFWNGKTYIAVIPDETERNYYVPDTLVELSLEDLKNRARYIQHNISHDKIVDPTDYHVLTDQEVDLYVTNWYDSNK